MTDTEIQALLRAHGHRGDAFDIAHCRMMGLSLRFSPDELSALLIAQAAQVEQLTADRDRWQAKAFDLGNGMMDAMTDRDVAQRTVSDDRHEHMVFNTLARDLWAELIAARAEIARLTRTP